MNLSYRKIKKVILEEIKKSLLLEISFEQAKESLDSKKTKRAIAKHYRKNYDEMAHEKIKNDIILCIPEDLEDKQKGLSLLWLLKNIKKNPEETLIYIKMEYYSILSNLETFWHWQRFMSEKDIMKTDIDSLEYIVKEAKPKIEEYQKSKKYNDAKEGTEILLDDESWFIAVIHNKGAACELGKGTDWCTAAPGLDFFERYYKPKDPLFFFEDKNSGEKYQFHFGSEQYMDKNDHQLPITQVLDLFILLYKTEAKNKYFIVEKAKDFMLEEVYSLPLDIEIKISYILQLKDEESAKIKIKELLQSQEKALFRGVNESVRRIENTIERKKKKNHDSDEYIQNLELLKKMFIEVKNKSPNIMPTVEKIYKFFQKLGWRVNLPFLSNINSTYELLEHEYRQREKYSHVVDVPKYEERKIF